MPVVSGPLPLCWTSSKESPRTACILYGVNPYSGP